MHPEGGRGPAATYVNVGERVDASALEWMMLRCVLVCAVLAVVTGPPRVRAEWTVQLPSGCSEVPLGCVQDGTQRILPFCAGTAGSGPNADCGAHPYQLGDSSVAYSPMRGRAANTSCRQAWAVNRRLDSSPQLTHLAT